MTLGHSTGCQKSLLVARCSLLVVRCSLFVARSRVLSKSEPRATSPEQRAPSNVPYVNPAVSLYNRAQLVGKLNVVVLYDRWEEPEESGATADKAPLTRTLDKKEVEEEVAETLGKLGHD